MRTGEGKTLVAILPAYLNALTGRGVHVVTVNDYLARRDCEWVGQVPRFLGLSVGLIQQGQSEAERRAAYAADVTYVTNSEVGFDYLRDNLAATTEELVGRGFAFALIDEVDSILIDEARTPLIISGMSDKPSDRYVTAAKVADAFERDVHYKVDEKQKSVTLTDDGYSAAEELLQVTDLYDPRTQWALFLINALKAKELQKRDVNYIVRTGEAVIVDEFTGRTMLGRRWSDGLHQAVEAKEGLAIQNETVTIASVTYQSFFRNYGKLAGMTGTAATEVTEFGSIYDLAVQVVPPNRPLLRVDSPDVVFRLASAKWAAVVSEVARMHKKGRPVLVGTTSVERSEELAELLRARGIRFNVLNAKPENVEREAEIGAQSGRIGAVTISTNMAGRGTDILLGGNAEFMARLRIREALMPRIALRDEAEEAAWEKRRAGGRVSRWAVDPQLYPCALDDETTALLEAVVRRCVSAWGEQTTPALEAEERLGIACEKGPLEDETLLALRAAFQAVDAAYRVVTEAERAEVRAAGGLHVVGTERHESRRIDNQLRGRSARQGDPGSTRFFLSLEDALFRIFGGERVTQLMSLFQVEDLPIESSMLSASLDEAQRKVETYFYDIRKQLFEYDAVLNSQREKLYAERRRALRASPEALLELMGEYATATVDDILAANCDVATPPDSWDMEALAAKFRQYCVQMADLEADTLRGVLASGGLEGLRSHLHARGRGALEEKRAEVEAAQAGVFSEAIRFFMLTQTDALWKEHLQAIKFVQQAVGLRGYAQRDPLIEYKLEGYALFVEMMAQIRRNVIYSVYQFAWRRAGAVNGSVEGAVPELGGPAKGVDEPEAVPAGAPQSTALRSAMNQNMRAGGGKGKRSGPRR
jgi:preprotein translocase subunit SecA